MALFNFEYMKREGLIKDYKIMAFKSIAGDDSWEICVTMNQPTDFNKVFDLDNYKERPRIDD